MTDQQLLFPVKKAILSSQGAGYRGNGSREKKENYCTPCQQTAEAVSQAAMNATRGDEYFARAFTLCRANSTDSGRHAASAA